MPHLNICQNRECLFVRYVVTVCYQLRLHGKDISDNRLTVFRGRSSLRWSRSFLLTSFESHAKYLVRGHLLRLLKAFASMTDTAVLCAKIVAPAVSRQCRIISRVVMARSLGPTKADHSGRNANCRPFSPRTNTCATSSSAMRMNMGRVANLRQPRIEQRFSGFRSTAYCKPGRMPSSTPIKSTGLKTTPQQSCHG